MPFLAAAHPPVVYSKLPNADLVQVFGIKERQQPLHRLQCRLCFGFLLKRFIQGFVQLGVFCCKAQILRVCLFERSLELGQIFLQTTHQLIKFFESALLLLHRG